VLTAPMPTSKIPSFPVGSAIFGGFFTTGNYIMGYRPHRARHLRTGRPISLSPSMKLFKKSETLDLPVAMSGVKLGDRLLVIGCSDPSLIARLALKVGLTGRACAVDESPARVAEAARLVERDGALIEAAEAKGLSVPYESEAFDLVVLRDSARPATDVRSRAACEALRVLRPGGRCLIVDGSTRSGLLWRSSPGHAGNASEAAVNALTAAGFAAVRALAEREGLTFVEGVKKNV
jgi:SAM-dependent methyltransferase